MRHRGSHPDGARNGWLPPQPAFALTTWWRGTRARLTLAYALAFAVIAAPATVLVSIYLARIQTGAIDDSLGAQAQVLTAGIDVGNGRITFQGGDQLPGQTSDGIAVDALLVDGQGTVLDRSGQSPPVGSVQPLIRAALGAASPVLDSVVVNGVGRRVRAQRVDIGNGQTAVLVVSRSTAEQETTLRRLLAGLIGIVGGLAAVASLLGYVLAGRALRPVRVIAATARDISERDLHRRLELDLPPDELGELAATFNQMLERLEVGFTVLQRFTADAAHELRAPLAVMLAEVDVSLRQSRSADDYRSTIERLRTDIQRLGRLADQLLTLARADAGGLHPSREQVDIPDLLEECAARWRPLITERGLRLDTALPDSGHLAADAELLRRLLDNLLDNAVKHTPGGGTITVAAERSGSDWRIEVADTGPGVPAALRPILFERFSRGDPARGPQTGGAGLGLALCAAIAQAHGGTIALGDGPGARLVVRIPGGD